MPGAPTNEFIATLLTFKPMSKLAGLGSQFRESAVAGPAGNRR
jgi:hypothetical protein